MTTNLINKQSLFHRRHTTHTQWEYSNDQLSNCHKLINTHNRESFYAINRGIDVRSYVRAHKNYTEFYSRPREAKANLINWENMQFNQSTTFNVILQSRHTTRPLAHCVDRISFKFTLIYLIQIYSKLTICCMPLLVPAFLTLALDFAVPLVCPFWLILVPFDDVAFASDALAGEWFIVSCVRLRDGDTNVTCVVSPGNVWSILDSIFSVFCFLFLTPLTLTIYYIHENQRSSQTLTMLAFVRSSRHWTNCLFWHRIIFVHYNSLWCLRQYNSRFSSVYNMFMCCQPYIDCAATMWFVIYAWFSAN